MTVADRGEANIWRAKLMNLKHDIRTQVSWRNNYYSDAYFAFYTFSSSTEDLTWYCCVLVLISTVH